MSSQSHFSDPAYIAWLKDTQALFCLKEGIEDITDAVATEFHDDLKKRLGVQACSACSPRDIVKDSHRRRWYMNCPVCDAWLQVIVRNHRSQPLPNIYLDNTNPQLWPTDPWEVLKCYMGRGCQGIHSAKDADLLNLLTLFKNCQHFATCSQIGRMDLVGELLAIRNSLFHSGNFMVDGTQLLRDMQTMLNFLAGVRPQSQLQSKAVAKAERMITERSNLSLREITEDDITKAGKPPVQKTDPGGNKPPSHRQTNANQPVINSGSSGVQNPSEAYETLYSRNGSTSSVDQQVAGHPRAETSMLPVTDMSNLNTREHMDYPDAQPMTKREMDEAVPHVQPPGQTVPPGSGNPDHTDSAGATPQLQNSGVAEMVPSANIQGSPSSVQGPSSMQVPHKTFFETFTDVKTKCKFEGRILTVDKSWCETAIQSLKSFDAGGYGQVFEVKHPEVTEMSVVIKRIVCQDDVDKARSAASEILAARLMHFAIVPLWAMAEDDHIYYLMLPYFVNKSLADNLGQDMKAIENRKQSDIKLNKPTRLRILYQVACAMAFLHREIPKFRRPFVHGDITTRNIVLDEKFNARLIDFGLAREYHQGKVGVTLKSSDMRGTPGYFQTSEADRLTVGKDVCNFSVVILETLTSKPPCTGGKKLKNKFKDKVCEKEKFLEDFEKGIKAVWGNFASGKFPTVNNPAIDKLLKLAEKCSKEVKSEKVRAKLDSIVSEYCPRRWEDPQAASDDNDKRCVVCLINPVDKDTRITLGHAEGCKLHVCVSCMRNSYLNPIECHSCGKTVKPPIGHKWAAVLVAGNDVNKKTAAEAFTRDLKKLHKAITSRHPMIMGISEKNVFTVLPTEPGTAEELRPKLQEAFGTLLEKNDQLPEKNVDTLLFYFTGHHSGAQGFKLGNSSEILTKKDLSEDSTKDWEDNDKDTATNNQQEKGGDSQDKEGEKGLEEYLNEAVTKCGFKRVFVLLDCCDAPELQLNGTCAFFQINSCIPGEESEFPEGEGSVFTEFFTKCLRGKSSSEICLLGQKKGVSSCSICQSFTSSNGFIKLHDLCDCVQKHVEEHDKHLASTRLQQVRLMSDNRGTNDVFAYFIDKVVSFKFALRLQQNGASTPHPVARLPETLLELQQVLFAAFTEKFPTVPKCADFADILAIKVSTGPRDENHQELDTLEKIESAWNGKRMLDVTPRQLEYVGNGRVGMFVGVGEAGKVLDLLKDCTDGSGQTLFQHSEVEKAVLVMATLKEGGARKLWNGVKKYLSEEVETPSEEVEMRTRLESQFETIKEDQKIGTSGKLVFTFPKKDDAGDLVTNFYSIHVETPHETSL